MCAGAHQIDGLLVCGACCQVQRQRDSGLSKASHAHVLRGSSRVPASLVGQERVTKLEERLRGRPVFRQLKLVKLVRHKMARLVIVDFIAFYCIWCVIFKGKNE